MSSWSIPRSLRVRWWRSARGAPAATRGVAAQVVACGGGESPNPTTPSPPSAARITISATGTVTPNEIVIAPGTRLLFVNDHGQPHHMASDPHPDHTDCPEINQVGHLVPGASRETGNMVTVRTCGFHDHINPNNGGLRGRIIIR